MINGNNLPLLTSLYLCNSSCSSVFIKNVIILTILVSHDISSPEIDSSISARIDVRIASHQCSHASDGEAVAILNRVDFILNLNLCLLVRLIFLTSSDASTMLTVPLAIDLLRTLFGVEGPETGVNVMGAGDCNIQIEHSQKNTTSSYYLNV